MKNFKKLTAVVLATAMTMGSSMSVFAAGDVTKTGEGSFEGGVTPYPTLQVTLPVIPEKAYDYIADPNGLIAKTGSASDTKDATSGDASGDIKYGKSKFAGNTGIFFRSGTTDAAGTAASGDVQKYAPDSEPLKVTNENAQDIEVTVKLEQETAGSSTITYGTTAEVNAAFSGDATRKLYIALTDGDPSGDPAVLGATPATITKTIEGKADNYVEIYNGQTGKYEYKPVANATGWNDWSCYLTGALNTNAKWEEQGITFPKIKVTWSAVEKTEEKPAVASASGGKTWISKDGTAGFGGAANVDSVTVDGQSVEFTGSDWISIAQQTSGKVIKVTLKDGTVYKAIVA